MNEEELRNMMYTAQLENMGPFAIRYPKGRGVMPKWKTSMVMVSVGKGRMIRDGRDVVIITLGHVGNYAMEACMALEKAGLSVAHCDLRFLKPLDEELLHEIFNKFSMVITVEDGAIMGGMGSAVLEFMADHGYASKVQRLGIPDHFIEQGSVAELHHECGFDTEGIIGSVSDLLKS
jgi:1-deoxy-D-xylulose-5-phosphate synthase